jgi:hypothetical protein
MQEFCTFTLSEANDALHEVILITDAALDRLRAIEEPWARLPYKKFDAYRGVAEEDLIRAEWAHRIASLGVIPKGFFVVDFQSPDPDTLYCWGYGEDCVGHEHKIWETFTQRRRTGSSYSGDYSSDYSADYFSERDDTA